MGCVGYGVYGIWGVWDMGCVGYGVCGIRGLWDMVCVGYGVCGICHAPPYTIPHSAQTREAVALTFEKLLFFWEPQVNIVDTESTACFRRCSTGHTVPVQKDAHLIADGGIPLCGEVGTRTCVGPCRVADSTTADTASDVCMRQEASPAVQPTPLPDMWRT